jgi:signal transduction histidine kinase
VLDDAGRPARRVGVNWDVTESKNAEITRQQAALAEREIQAKSQFLSRMSHELRTPLNAVLGFTQLLQIEARQSRHADQLSKLEHVRDAGEHLLSLINDVPTLRPRRGEVRLALRPSTSASWSASRCRSCIRSPRSTAWRSRRAPPRVSHTPTRRGCARC